MSAFETRQIDKLFLELSQFTGATTAKELQLQTDLWNARRALLMLVRILPRTGIEEEIACFIEACGQDVTAAVNAMPLHGGERK